GAGHALDHPPSGPKNQVEPKNGRAITCTSPPTSASWLNQVEHWFGKITDERIRRDSFHSVPALVAAIELYILAHNRKSKPFVWTASADLILERVKKTL